MLVRTHCKMFVRFTLFISILFMIETMNLEDCAYECEENQRCIKHSELCNGTADCPFGSDETVNACKRNEFFEKDLTFNCAYGAEIDYNSRCNNSPDCYDGSDESLSLCKSYLEFNKTVQGKCLSNQLECSRHECIYINKICDGTIDCINGRDESVEVCMKPCDLEQHFQCGNGQCINKDLLCDNKYDCIDGADEFPNLCDETVDWVYKLLPRCIEPTEKNLTFTNITKFHRNSNYSYVYANEPVSFECTNRRDTFAGNESNVCLNTGKWRWELPHCTPEPIDYNPDTNGINGCVISTYHQYKNKLLIHRCDPDDYCKIPITPPINNIKIRYSCKRGYTLLPEKMQDKTQDCYNKIWSIDSDGKYPRCVRKCRSSELICHDFLRVIDCTRNNVSVPCNKPTLLPGTVVTISCKLGFQQKIESYLKKTCLENGTWSSNYDDEKLCAPNCGQINMEYSRNAIKYNLTNSPWTYAIFWKNTSTSGKDYECGGALIRPNVILTAAHCVYGKLPTDLLVAHAADVGSTNHFFTVSKIGINPQYVNLSSDADIALLKFENTDRHNPIPICLADFDNGYDSEVRPGRSLRGEVCSWNTDQLNNNGNFEFTVSLFDAPRISNSPFVIRHYKNMLCKGDSGSGFLSDCYVNGESIGVVCLYGVVSQSSGGASINASCSTEIQVTKTAHYINKGYISSTIREWSQICDAI